MLTQLERNLFHNAEDYLPRANTFIPTPHDPCKLTDYEDYFYFPVILTRDSLPREQSNYEAAKSIVWEASNCGETTELSFGHWACGWLSVIVIHQDDEPGIVAAINLVCALEDYPILDEERFAELQLKDAQTAWEWCDLKARIDVCLDAGISIFAARHENVPTECIPYLVE